VNKGKKRGRGTRTRQRRSSWCCFAAPVADAETPPRPAKRRRRAHRSLSGGPGGEGCLRGSVPFLYGNQVLHLELYRLLTILEASPALADFEGSDESDKQQVDFLRRGHEFAEVSRIVVSLAAIIRSEITAILLADKGYYDLPQNRPVGVLRSDLSVPGASEDLYFREACNKILHADQVNPEQTPDNGALTGQLTLYGRFKGKNWQAKLDLRGYAMAAMALPPY
jgi:hypothetical protein